MTKKILILLIALNLTLAGCNNSTNQETWQDKWEEIIQQQKITSVKYENKQYRLKLDFLSNRTFEENVYWSTVMFFVPKEANKITRENLWITIKLTNSGTNLETFYQDNKEMIQWIASDFLIEKENDLKIDNYPAKQIQYSFSQEWHNIKQEQTIIIKEELAYIINYTATKETFDHHKKDIDNIIKSLSIR